MPDTAPTGDQDRITDSAALVVLLLQRRMFEPTREIKLPKGMPVPRIGEAIVAPDGDDDDPPYMVEKVEHDPGKRRVLVVAKPSNWGARP